MTSTQELDARARKAAQAYQGEFAWFTVALALGVAAAYLGILAAAAMGSISLVAAALLTAPVVYVAYTVLHEAAHGSVSGCRPDLRWLNDAMGYIAAWIMMIPLTAHRHEHLSHHRNTNHPDADPDYAVASISRASWRMFPAVIKILVSQYRYYFTQRWHKAPRSQNLRFCLELVAIIAPRLAFMAMGFWAEGLAVFVVGGLGGMLITMYLFAYIVHQPHRDVGPYVDTAAIEAPPWCNGLVTWLWLFQNYHAVHHLFPRVPFYRYQRLFREIEPVMVARGTPIYDLGLRGLVSRERSLLAFAHG